MGAIYLTSSGTLQLRSGSTTIGTSAALSTGTLYRVGIHQKAGTGTNGVLEAYVATGDAAFGTAFASSNAETFTSQATQVRLGATNSSAVDATVDDIRLDTAVMPDPSGGSSPTATPTNTPTGPTATPTNTPVGPTATPTNTPSGPTATPTNTATPSGSAPIKSITFEGGSLTDATTGFDSAASGATLESSAPLKGSYSATIANNATGNLSENFTGVNTLYVSLYLRAASFPASARLVQIQNSGTTVGAIYLTSSGTLQLRSGSTTIGTSAALSTGTLYRIGLRQQAGSGSNGIVEAFLATGDAAFGAAFASSSTETFTSQASKLVVGATNSNAVDVTVDDVMLDSAAMPGPSGGGVSPTATPTNTPMGATATPTNTPTGPTATPTNTPVGATATPTTVPNTAPPAYDMTMTYNGLGSITSKTGVGAYGYPASGANSVRPHTPNTVGGAAYTYDNNGNLMSGGGRSYVWTPENLPASITSGTVTENYTYDADNERVAKAAGGATTIYFQGVFEQTVGAGWKQYYSFNGQTVAMRDNAGTVTYLHGDHLGSVSLATNSTGALASQQEFDPWGAVRTGSVGQTGLNYTGQRLDGTGLLYYHARMYDPVLARFVSADSVVPGSASGSLDGIALKPLTVDFHEVGFGATLNGENGQPFWFQMSDQQRQKAGDPWGPANPQALNRYSYVLNGPMKATDPTGHSIYLTGKEAQAYAQNLRDTANSMRNLAKALEVVGFFGTTLGGGLLASDTIKGMLMKMSPALVAYLGQITLAGIEAGASAYLLNKLADELEWYATVIDAANINNAGVILSLDSKLTYAQVTVISRSTGNGQVIGLSYPAQIISNIVANDNGIIGAGDHWTAGRACTSNGKNVSGSIWIGDNTHNCH